MLRENKKMDWRLDIGENIMKMEKSKKKEITKKGKKMEFGKSIMKKVVYKMKLNIKMVSWQVY